MIKLDLKLLCVVLWWMAWLHMCCYAKSRTNIAKVGATFPPNFFIPQGQGRRPCPEGFPYAYDHGRHCCNDAYQNDEPSQLMDIYDSLDVCVYDNRRKCPGRNSLCKTSKEVPLWTQWGAFSPCLVTCGSGLRTRERTCQPHGETCPGPNEEKIVCYTGSECPFVPELLFITGGHGTYTSELLSLGSETCVIPLPNLALPSGHQGAFFKHNGDPVFCTEKSDSSCVRYSPHFNTWESFGKLTTRRYGAAVLQLEDYILVTGGDTGGSPKYVRTTDYWNAETEKFEAGPDMPYAAMLHCIAAINGTYALLTGGYVANSGQQYLNQAYMFDKATKQWTQMASMSAKRRQHACGLVGHSKVFVAGGGAPSASKTVEVFDLVTHTWSSGKVLPVSIVGATSVQLEDTFLIVGGTTNNRVYEYDLDNDNWIRWPQDMVANRKSWPAVYIIGINYLNCA